MDDNRDVVGARLKLDTSKLTPAFKVVDGGARQNAESFKKLNAEISVTEKTYVSLARAMDKTALSSEQRQKKIQDESNALVAQRRAQAELISAKTAAMNKTNTVVDEKMRAQAAIVLRREQAIEQQEKQHQARMQTLQNRANASANTDRLVQARLDRQLQITRTAQTKLEQQTAAHQARLNRLNQQAAGNTVYTTSLADKFQNAVMHATVYQALYSAIHVAQAAIKEGLVGIESNMAGYMQTNEAYFVSFNEGTHEMVVNTQRLHEETTKFIQTAHDLGAQIGDVTESARLWGRMYKDVGIVQELVRQSTQLSVVDMVSLESATKGMESVLSQYGVQIENTNDAMVIGNRVLDSWSKVAHDTMAPAKDLAAAFQRTGKIASETGVSFDFMNGLIASGVRNTALSGENLGNMWKTVLGTIRTDKAVKEIESLGVATTQMVDGMEQWRKAEDILLDLSIAVTNKNYDLTESYAAISRGVYQYAKLAASLNAGDILLGTASSIGSSGATLEYLQVQMDTISRKASQVKTSLLEIFNQAGDDGLRRSIKDVLDALDRLMIGLTKVPTGVYAMTAALGGALLAYKALKAPVLNLMTAVSVLTTAKTADATATAASTAANEVNTTTTIASTVAQTERAAASTAGAAAQMNVARATTAATAAMSAEAAVMTVVTGGLVLLGAAFAGVAFAMGADEKARRDRVQALKDEDSVNQQLVSQYQRQIDLLPKLVNAHNSYQQMLDSGTLAEDQAARVKKQLDEVSQALVITLGSEGAAQLKAAGYTEQAVRQQVDALNGLIAAKKEASKAVLEDQRDELLIQQSNTQAAIDKKQKELQKATESLERSRKIFSSVWLGGDTSAEEKKVQDLTDQLSDLTAENNKLIESLADVNVSYAEAALAADQLAGSNGKATDSTEEAEEALADLKDQIQNNGSAVSQLNQVLSDLRKAQSMNAENAADLIIQYPQLADKIYKTADGWAFETDAVEELRKAKIQKAIDDLNSEKSSELSTLTATQNRMKAYGIEMQGIKDLATYKAKMNEAVDKRNKLESSLNGTFASSMNANSSTPFSSLFGVSEATKGIVQQYVAEEDAALDAISSVYDEYFEKMDEYDQRIGALTKLYNDPNYGVSSDSSSSSKDKSSSSSSSNDDPQAKAFEASQDWIDHRKKMGQLTLEQELQAWQRIQSQYAQGTEWRKKADEQVYSLQQQILEKKQNAEKEAYDASMNWLSHQKAIREVSASEELAILEKLQARYKVGTEERMKLDELVYAAKKAALTESMSQSEAYLAHEKAMGRLSLEAELKAWERIQQRYVKGSEERMKADEQVYALKKELMEQEQTAAEKLATNQKSIIDKLQKAELERIKAEKEAYIAAKDAEIEALDALLDAEEEANEDEDFEKELAKKQARLAELESAVGPDGLKERRELQEEIADMLVDRQRTLYKREIEAQKQQLEDEKDLKTQEYDDQIEALEDHYQELLDAFDSFSSDTAEQAESLKQLQILKESEKNEAILDQLDSFIASYQAKMSTLSSLSLSQEDQDLAEYNSNKDAYEEAKAQGDAAEMARLTARNAALRAQYGITTDTGKLQHFSEGGEVQGRTGEAVPVIAHAGEIVLNGSQQSNLMRLLNFQMPQLSYDTPTYEKPSQQSVTNHNYYTVSTGDVTIDDASTATVFWSERDSYMRNIQSRAGDKQR
ncbi:minor tail protein [Paenibacillus cellulosilyticus]|uniref:Minor tail protein n=1 Tax=Paenibacillus cellulosilyticus TaxID=375489 RepID=A0A2V2YX55_9BACL|nr:phage tail tape measure protein [Paenibacillus cellulosilyticus]PWW06337.1 minor tail protein [Paenibacillus cellulosilyticus]QKS43447.1 phage tail tape measure protein [Paenibacillus cellulosilyticus]QKS46311.1 phage tail tape measure protein [Paenibacillus cellulosilyticus]